MSQSSRSTFSRSFRSIPLAIALSVLVFAASRAIAAPLIESTANDRSSSLADLTAADDRFLAWDDAAPPSPSRDLANPDAPAVVASGDALTTAFDGENPIIPVPPSLVVGLVGLAVVGGIAIRRQQPQAASKFF